MPKITERQITLGLFLAAIAVALWVFSVGQRHIPVSTDESIIALQSRHILFPPAESAIRESLHPKPLFFRFPLLFMAQPYLFPLEAYMAAPVASVLPVGPFGARMVPFAMGLLTILFSFLILRRLKSLRQAWPGYALLIFPSTYVAMLQYGYALPSYPSHLLFLALGIWLTIRYIEHPSWLKAGLLGVVCAAAVAGQLMAMPLALMCGVLMFWAGPGWWRLLHSAVFGGISLTGFFPYMLAGKLYPGAYDVVSGRWPLREALGRIWAPLLNHVLPVASGIQSTVFPDNLEHVEWLPWLTRIWPVLWVAVLAVTSVIWLWGFCRRRFNLRASADQAFIIFVGLSVAAVFLFAISRRSHSHTYRYMLTAAWSLPFVLAYLHARLTCSWGRCFVAGVTVLLAGLNALTMASVMGQWATPRFAADEAWLHDIRPALAYLEQEQITAVYASYHLAYRLTYGSDEHITAAQYYNERFPGWPLPYRSYVDQAERPAYVMAPRFAITADRLEQDLVETGITYTKASAGDLTIFHNFRWDREGDWLRPSGLRASASHSPESAPALINGNPVDRWRARGAQQAGMWVAVEWDSPVVVTELYMFYDFFRHDRAQALAIEMREQGEWQSVVDAVPMALDAVLFDNGRPLYGHEFQRISLPLTEATGIRVRIATPMDGRDWAIGDIRLWGQSAPDS